jgi:hypothetical protein
MGASKTISEPMVHSTQNRAVSCVKIRTISKLTELSLEPRHLRVPLGAPYRFLSKWYVWCKPCTDLATDANSISKEKEFRFHMTHVTYEFHRVRPK